MLTINTLDYKEREDTGSLSKVAPGGIADSLPGDPFLKKYILREGPDGLTIRDEIELNPYSIHGKLHKDPCTPKMRETVRRVSKEEKGYLWTMGYNNCVGRYSGGEDYSLFCGSSLNRSLKFISDAEKLRRSTKNLIELAIKIAAKMSGFPGWAVSGPIYDLLLRPNDENKGKYRLWFQCQVPEYFDGLEGISFGIHVFSDRSRGKVKDKATAFFRACPGSRVFLTLTFIAAVSDQDGVSILNKFLTYIRKKHSGFQFLWVAERQLNNKDFPGNIHFHLIMNKRLPVREYNGLWVLQQYNAGLRAKNKYGEMISMEEITQRYQAGTVGKVLNPLDIDKIRSIGGLSHYLTKYITKQEKNSPFGCAPWHCSRGVSKLFTKAVVTPSAFRYCCSINNCKVDKKTGEVFEAQAIKKPFFVMVFINNKSVPLNYLKEMETINKWMLGGMEPDKLRSCNDELYRKYFLCQN